MVMTEKRGIAAASNQPSRKRQAARPAKFVEPAMPRREAAQRRTMPVMKTWYLILTIRKAARG